MATTEYPFHPPEIPQETNEPGSHGRPEPEKAWHFDAGKPAYQLLPPFGLDAVAKVAAYGEQKYGAWNWAEYADEWNWLDLMGSLLRHAFAFLRGEYWDRESGLPHLAHAAFNALMLIDLFGAGKGTDNRSPLAIKDTPTEDDRINYDLKDEERPLTFPPMTPWTAAYWNAQIERNDMRSEDLDKQLEETRNPNPVIFCDGDGCFPWEEDDGQTTKEAPPGKGEPTGSGGSLGGNDPCATWASGGSRYPPEEAVSGLREVSPAQHEARETERGRR